MLEEVAQLGDEFGSMIEVALMLVMVDKEKEEIVLESTEDQARESLVHKMYHLHGDANRGADHTTERLNAVKDKETSLI